MNAFLRNELVNLFITSGLYRLALGAAPREDEAVGASATELTLIEINLAEAEYNLGRWREAERRLAPLDAAAGRRPITRAGLLQQRAWIAARLGRGAEALELCGRASIRWLPPAYQAEHHFTRAAALLALRRFDQAEAEVAAGRRIAVRPASHRNALFLFARIAAARLDWAAAERWCREGSDHAFRGQGGDGLLLWGRALGELGRPEEAIRAFALAVERDPESESAALAAAELRAAGAAAPGRR